MSADSKYNNLLMAYIKVCEQLKNPERDKEGLRAHIAHLEEELNQLKTNYNWICERLTHYEKENV